MDIRIRWHKVRSLTNGSKHNLIYTCNLTDIPNRPGIYIFARLHGQTVEPIYIGETLKLGKRIEQHLKYVPLMKAIENKKRGKRVLMYGTLSTGKGIRPKRVLQRIERALIKYALAQGHELTNWKGARTPYDTIHFKGHLRSRNLFGMRMNLEK